MKTKTLLAIAAAAIAMPVLAAQSGLKAGEMVTPFHPTHIAGPLANSTKCFPCTFQARPQVQVWVNGDDMGNVVKIAESLAKAIKANEKSEFKAMIVLVTDAGKTDATKEAALTAMKGKAVDGVSVAILPRNDAAVAAYKVNLSGEVKNTVFVYKDWKVAATMVNLKSDAKSLDSLTAAIANVAK